MFVNPFSGKLSAMNKLSYLIFVTSLSWGLQAALAAPAGVWPDNKQQQRLYQQVQAGEVVSLEVILAYLRERYDGEIVEIELEDDDGMLVYEIEMIGPQGQRAEFEFAARTGELMSVEGRQLKAMSKQP